MELALSKDSCRELGRYSVSIESPDCSLWPAPQSVSDVLSVAAGRQFPQPGPAHETLRFVAAEIQFSSAGSGVNHSGACMAFRPMSRPSNLSFISFLLQELQGRCKDSTGLENGQPQKAYPG